MRRFDILQTTWDDRVLTGQRKVVELEIQLDEMKEQYNNVIRNSNSKAQKKKMAFLERNLEQLTLVQKQVRLRTLTSMMSELIGSLKSLLSRIQP